MQIVIIGSGRVATHLGLALKKSGNTISQVVSKQLRNAQQLALQLDAQAGDKLHELKSDADLYIISVSDDAIPTVVNQLPGTEGIVVHTAGSVSLSQLSKFKKHGVFYPFQTFSKSKPLNFREIPLLVEGNTVEVGKQLLAVAAKLSDKTYIVDSRQRMQLHVAAVFACNFTNHMYLCAESLLSKANLPFSLLLPLIQETADKMNVMSPADAQTGPASRKDLKTIENHVKLLNAQNDQGLLKVYEDLSQHILSFPKDRSNQ